MSQVLWFWRRGPLINDEGPQAPPLSWLIPNLWLADLLQELLFY